MPRLYQLIVFLLIFAPIESRSEVFLRGDANQDLVVNLSDAVSILNYLFVGGAEPGCLDSADTNDDGKIDTTDAVTVLRFLYLGDTTLASPAGFPGMDLTEDDISCKSYPAPFTIEPITPERVAFPQDVNDNGLIAGYFTPRANQEAFLYESTSKTFHAAGANAGGSSRFNSVNDLGIAIGANVSPKTFGTWVARYEVGNGYTFAEALNNAWWSSSTAINNSGVAVGCFLRDGESEPDAFRWDTKASNSFERILTQLRTSSCALELNSQGDIVGLVGGSIRDASGDKIFVLRNGNPEPIMISRPPHLSGLYPHAITDDGTIIAEGIRSGHRVALIYSNFQTLSFEHPDNLVDTEGRDINSGHIGIGSLTRDQATKEGIVLVHGTSYPLKELIDDSAGEWSLEEPTAISGNCFITGSGRFRDQPDRGFLLRPKTDRSICVGSDR